MFGSEAAKLLDYVECYPDGIKAGTKMAEACYDIELQAFPSWLINGEVRYSLISQLKIIKVCNVCSSSLWLRLFLLQLLSGVKQFPELAHLSGINLQDLSH